MRLHQHDCEGLGCCAYLGSTNRADVYLTRSEKVIVRFSSEGCDYYCTTLTQALTYRDDMTWAAAIQIVERTLH